MRLLRHNSRFMRIWLANVLSQTGTQVSRIALLLYLATTWNSPVPIAALLVVETLPALLAAPIAGLAADRFNKARVMVIADLVRLVAMAAVLWQPTLSVMLPAAALHAVATAFFQPAKSSAIPRVVDPDQLVAANAVEQAAANLVFIAGPALGAELLLRVGLEVTLLLDCASFLVSAALIASVRVGARPNVSDTHPIAEIVSGWRYLRAHPSAFPLCGIFFIGLLCAGVWTPLAPFFVRDFLDGTGRTLGWQFVLFGTGAVAGSVLAPRAIRAIGKGPLLFCGFAGEGVAQTVYAAASDLVWSTGVMLLWGASVSCLVVPFHAMLQSMIDDRFLGRTFAAVRQAEGIATIVAMGATMLLTGWLDSRTILLAGGLVYCTLAAATWCSARGRVLIALP